MSKVEKRGTDDLPRRVNVRSTFRPSNHKHYFRYLTVAGWKYDAVVEAFDYGEIGLSARARYDRQNHSSIVFLLSKERPFLGCRRSPLALAILLRRPVLADGSNYLPTTRFCTVICLIPKTCVIDRYAKFSRRMSRK